MTYHNYKVTIPAGVLKFPMSLAFIVEDGRAVAKMAISRRVDVEDKWDIGLSINRMDHTKPLYMVIGLGDGDILTTEVRQMYHPVLDLSEDVDPVEMDQDLRASGIGTFEETGSGAEALKNLFKLA